MTVERAEIPLSNKSSSQRAAALRAFEQKERQCDRDLCVNLFKAQYTRLDEYIYMNGFFCSLRIVWDPRMYAQAAASVYTVCTYNL